MDNEEYYFDDAVGGSEGGYSGDASNYDSDFSDWNYNAQDTESPWDYSGGNTGTGNQDFWNQNPEYDPSQKYFTDIGSGNQYWKDDSGKFAGFQEYGGDFTPYGPGAQGGAGGAGGGFDWSKVGSGASGVLNSLFAPRAGGQAGGMDIIKGLSPFLAALYNKKTAPAQAAATNQYIQGQQQRLDPFNPYRQEASANWQASNQRLMDLKNNRNLSPEMLAQEALSKYTVGRQNARGSNRFNNGRTQLMAGLANQRNLILDEMKLNDMYARQGGSGINPSSLESLLSRGLASNQNAANPNMGLFAALGQMNNNQSPQAFGY